MASKTTKEEEKLWTNANELICETRFDMIDEKIGCNPQMSIDSFHKCCSINVPSNYQVLDHEKSKRY